MTVGTGFDRVREPRILRGFRNLYRKESQSWWGTRRWWINALIWPAILGGLVFIMLFILPSIAQAANDPNIAEAGGPLPFAIEMGRTVFFEMGTMALAVGVVILTQDVIIQEKQSGAAEWILSKPVARQSYILAKLCAMSLVVLVLMITLPAVTAYGLFYFRAGEWFPPLAFLTGVGVMVVHTFFYLSLTLAAGSLFNNRAPILGIGLGSLLGGSFVGGFLKPLLTITPWMLAKVASSAASGAPIPREMVVPPLIATAGWSVVWVALAIWRFKREEF
jgi:ABC-type transport system involved in multi-copper enzyme maturation permease subunit